MSTIPSAQILVWIASNRGAIARIALDMGVSGQFVAMVLKGVRKSKDGKVERALRAEGAPI